MTEFAGLTHSGAEAPHRVTAIITVGDVHAEYSTGRRANGEWFALANVNPAPRIAVGPARLVIGLGRSAEEALQRMTAHIETDAFQPEAATSGS